jgi:hypothetical protein
VAAEFIRFRLGRRDGNGSNAGSALLLQAALSAGLVAVLLNYDGDASEEIRVGDDIPYVNL